MLELSSVENSESGVHAFKQQVALFSVYLKDDLTNHQFYSETESVSHRSIIDNFLSSQVS